MAAGLREVAGRAERDSSALLNDSLTPDLERGKFMTFFLGAVDPATGALQWASAGHPAPILLRKSGACEELAAGGVMLGVFGGFTYPAGDPVTLEPGDTLLVYTDGATEAAAPGHGDDKTDEHMFGEERLKALLREVSPKGPEAVLDAVRTALHEYTASPHLKDDLTLLVLQRS